MKIEFSGENTNFLTISMVDKLLIQNTKTVRNLRKSVIDLYGLEDQVNKHPYVAESSVFYGHKWNNKNDCKTTCSNRKSAP